MYAWLNTVGFSLGIVGVVLIFIWGPPQPSLQEGRSLGIQGPEVDRHNARVRSLRSRHNSRSRIGLGLILVGFGLQLIGTWP